MTYLLACHKPWCAELAHRLTDITGQLFELISDKQALRVDRLTDLKPDMIFFPHWSYIIPEKIFSQFECVIFHMTDLPYGRGGSPLQNLIVRGHKKTMISALRCVKELDAGPIYLKKPLSLHGNAEEIYLRAAKTIESMIVEILNTNPLPKEQEGEVVEFKRRKPEDSKLNADLSLEQLFDYIRMLDADGYPPAFIKWGNYRIELSRASLKSDGMIADVRIIEEEDGKA